MPKKIIVNTIQEGSKCGGKISNNRSHVIHFLFLLSDICLCMVKEDEVNECKVPYTLYYFLCPHMRCKFVIFRYCTGGFSV